MKKYKDIHTLPKMYTHEEVLKRVLVSQASRDAYNEEILRLRLASQIRKLRIKQQLTQKDLAEQANMPQSVIARVEGGNHSISFSTLSKIVYALGKEVRLVTA